MSFALVPRLKLPAPAAVRPEALNVAPNLVGAPLAPHGRRLLAMGLDLAVIGTLSATGEFWIAACIAGLLFQFRRRPDASWGTRFWLALGVALLVAIGAFRAREALETRHAPAHAAATVSASAAAGNATDAASSAENTAANDEAADPPDPDDTPAAARDGVQAASPVAAAKVSDRGHAASDSNATSAQAQALAAAEQRAQQAQSQVKHLRAELAEARKPQAVRWRDQLTEAARALARGFGWAIAYFTLLPYWWDGRTLGKKVFGLRVVELTGKPLGLMTCFSRYGGYAAGMATGMTGFAQVLWDANRQGIEDKLAHTVVIDVRRA